MYSYHTETDIEKCKKSVDEIVKENRLIIGTIKVFTIIWFSILISIGGLISLVSFSDVFLGTSYGEGSAILGLITPLIMFIFGIVIVKLGVWLSKNEEEYVLEFIKKTLNAKEI
jgi:uncharacterized membrane protein (DUF485 family)